MYRRIIHLVLVSSAAFLVACGDEPANAPITAEQINAATQRANLKHFEDHLMQCPKEEIRCLWFLDHDIGIGMVMTLNLHTRTADTVRDVYDHARQGHKTRELSHPQIMTLESLIPTLPPSHANVPFADGLHVSFWLEGKFVTRVYSTSGVPAVIQRLYDIGGGAFGFSIAK